MHICVVKPQTSLCSRHKVKIFALESNILNKVSALRVRTAKILTRLSGCFKVPFLSCWSVWNQCISRWDGSHQDPHCLPFCYWFSIRTTICKNECVQIQRWNSQFQKIRGERVLWNWYSFSGDNSVKIVFASVLKSESFKLKWSPLKMNLR